MVVHAHAGKLWGRLRTLDALRSIAVLAVCSFHYTNAQFIERFGHFRRVASTDFWV
jgi:peptidoglycan/LPS O-acetylase OafA/YrhL